MKTFKDLQFKPHDLSHVDSFKDSKQAVETFDNGYGVSILLGSCFYSNGIDTYELAILKDGAICYTSGITEGVEGYLKESEVTELMVKIQQL